MSHSSMIDENAVQVVLTLDIGSSSIRCGAHEVTSDSKIVRLDDCFAFRTLRTVEPLTGKIELTTEQGTSLLDEIDALVDTTLKKLRRHPTPIRVVGVGFASFCMNLIGMDARGVPVGKDASISYACASPNAAQECQRLKSFLGPKVAHDLYQRTGTPLHSSYALPQLRTLYSNHEMDHVVSQIVVWQTLSSACLSRWMGKPFTHISYSEASWTGLFNFRTLEWDEEALALLSEACMHHMPPLCDYCDDEFLSGGIPDEIPVVGVQGRHSRNPYWERWPELAQPTSGDITNSCRFFVGLGDGVCANIGSKCCTKQTIAVTIGTSAAARVCIPLTHKNAIQEFVVPRGLFCYRLDRSHVVVGGALTDGGSIIAWARQLLNLQDHDEFANCLTQVEQLLHQDYQDCQLQDNILPCQTAITLVPFLSGERSTGYRDGACFCVSGMTRTSTSAHFVKACLEGVVLRLQAILIRLRQIVDSDDNSEPRLVASGSALEKNDLWRQMLADCSGLPVQLPVSLPESTSLGVAKMIAVALAMRRDAVYESVSYLSRDQTIEQSVDSSPCLSITERYWMVASKNQEQLIDAVCPLW